MIQRYDLEEPFATKFLRIPNGDWVKYEDHRALLDKANAAIKEAYQNGKKEGARQVGTQPWQTGFVPEKNPFVGG